MATRRSQRRAQQHVEEVPAFHPESVFIGRLSPQTIGSRITCEEDAITFCQYFRLIPDFNDVPQSCTFCEVEGRMCSQKDKRRKVGFRWKCQACRGRRDPLERTFFQRSNLSIVTILYIILCFIGRFGFQHTTLLADVCEKTAGQWLVYCCEVCQVVMSHFPKIGGPGTTVEIDESCLVRNKYNRGRALAPQKKNLWIFGAVQRREPEESATAGKALMFRVRNRKMETLEVADSSDVNLTSSSEFLILTKSNSVR